jgi:hypothetical protein
VLKREIPVPGGNATSIAVSSSLKTIYYIAQNTIYAMPEGGGPPVRFAEGDDMAIDPEGRLLVLHNSQGMARVQLPSKAVEPIALPAGIRLATGNLSPAAIDRKDRVLLDVVTPQAFDYKAAVAEGPVVTVISADRPGDNLVPGWTPEGDVIAMHDLLRSELWRFSQRGAK